MVETEGCSNDQESDGTRLWDRFWHRSQLDPKAVRCVRRRIPTLPEGVAVSHPSPNVPTKLNLIGAKLFCVTPVEESG